MATRIETRAPTQAYSIRRVAPGDRSIRHPAAVAAA
jgi:hypothetical protein